MSEHTGYFDEDGNELTVEEVAALGDDVEIVEEVQAPAAQQPAAVAPTPATATQSRKVPKGLIAGAVAVVVLVGGGAAWGLHTIGQQNTVEDVQSAISSKTEAAKSTVASKSSEVLGPESTEEEPARTGTRVTVEGCLDPAQAVWDGEGDMPQFRLRRESATDLPATLRALVKKRHDNEPREVSMAQPEKGALWIYASGALGGYQVAKASIVGGVPVVLDTATVRRQSHDVGVCPTRSRTTSYAVVDGNKERSIEVLASKSAGGVLYAVSDDEILELTLEKVDPPAEEEAGGDAATSPTASAVPSK